MICGFCTKETGGVRSYLRHVSFVHRGDSNFHISCGIDGCPITFRRFSSFTSHVYRKHSHAVSETNESEDTERSSPCLQYGPVEKQNASLKMCCFCDKAIGSVTELISHLSSHISKNDQVECPVKNCCKEYDIISSFTSHMSRLHRNITLDDIKDCFDLAQSSSVMQNTCTCSSFEEGIQEVADVESNDLHVYLESLMKSLLRLQEFQRLPVSTIDRVVDEMKITVSLSFDCTKSSVMSLLKADGVRDETLESVAHALDNNIFQSSIGKIDTIHKRKSYISNHFPNVKPVRISLGVNSRHKERTFQYVPIRDTIKCMLKSSSVLAAIVEGSNQHLHDASILSDFADGIYYNSSDFFKTNPMSLQIILYFDEFEVVNPIGSKRGKQKLAAVYMALGNINVFERADLKSIQLCILCPVIDVKEFGINKMFEPLVFDLKVLETDGIHVTELQQNLKGTVIYICADNLGSHQIGGFLESFGSNVLRICRFCMATSREIQDTFDPSHFPERDKCTYNYHLQQVESNPSLKSVYGLKCGSIFNELQYFHVSQGLPPDCMHDLLEGCAKKEISVILDKLVSESCFSESELVSHIRLFQYGKCDINNKPAEPKTLANIATQSASQMWTLIRMLPLILGCFIPVGNRAWEIYLIKSQHLDWLDLTGTPVINLSFLQGCTNLQTLLLGECSLIPDKDFENLSYCTKLVYLDAGFTRLTGNTLANVIKSPICHLELCAVKFDIVDLKKILFKCSATLLSLRMELKEDITKEQFLNCIESYRDTCFSVWKPRFNFYN